jgi:hypothetical protein
LGGLIVTLVAPKIPNVLAEIVKEPIAATGAIKTYDPVIISMVRQFHPRIIAYDLCGVQEMTGPTGLVFAMTSKYKGQNVAIPDGALRD